MADPDSSSSPRFSNYRWLIIGFAFLATVLNYLDRQTLSVVAPQLRDRFGITDSDYGTIIAAFMLAYTVMNGVSGVIIDRLGTRMGYAVMMVWWSGAGMLHAFARGAFGFGFCRFLLGMGEAGNWPAGVKAASEWFPPKERALAGGIFNSGSSVGALLAAPMVAWIVLKIGFQQSFVIIGALGFVWVVGWLFVYRRSPVRAVASVGVRAPAWRLLKTRFVTAFALSNIFMDSVWYFYIFWIPKYLSGVFHFSLADIGKTAWIPFVTADLGNIAGGAFTGWLIKRGWQSSTARKTGSAVFALLMPSAIPAIYCSSPAAAIAWVCLATFGYTGFVANGLAFPADVFPESMVASVYGLASMGSGFGGMIFGWLSGWLIERYGYFPAFIGCGVFPLIGLAFVLFMMGPLKPDPRFRMTPVPGYA